MYTNMVYFAHPSVKNFVHNFNRFLIYLTFSTQKKGLHYMKYFFTLLNTL